MKENIEYKGQWFLPSNRNNRLHGVLTYDRTNGSSLELFGNFDGSTFIPRLQNDTIILGLTSNSKEVTLYRCFVTKTGGGTLVSGGETGVTSTIYTVNYVLEGAHIDSEDQMKFQKITSEIYNMDEWVGISGFIPEKSAFESAKKHEINVHYKIPEPIRFKINKDLDGQFNFLVNHPGWSRFQKNINLEQRVEIIISSTSGFGLEELLKFLFGFQNFLVLALYSRTYPIAITLYGDNFTKVFDGEQPLRKKIKLYLSIANSSASTKSKFDLEMLFGYGHIREEFPEIISNWYEKYELLEPAFNLLFEQFYSSDRFSENTFLNLAQAAETFHARTDNHTKMQKGEYDKMKERIYATAPEEYRGWLKDQFNWGNSLNLQTRLTEMVSKYSNKVLDKIIGDKQLFVKQVKWSRNYYTHYSSGGEKNALKGQELFFLTEKLKILLVCAFLLEVGFSKEKLEKLLEQNKYRFFNHLVKW